MSSSSLSPFSLPNPARPLSRLPSLSLPGPATPLIASPTSPNNSCAAASSSDAALALTALAQSSSSCAKLPTDPSQSTSTVQTLVDVTDSCKDLQQDESEDDGDQDSKDDEAMTLPGHASPSSPSSTSLNADSESSYTPSTAPSRSKSSADLRSSPDLLIGNTLDDDMAPLKSRPYFRCPHPGCSQGFTRRQNLRSHMTIHTNERPHPCPKCSATFRRRQELLRHGRSVHAPAGVKSFQCVHCERLFGRADALKRHILANGGVPGENGSPPWACLRPKSMAAIKSRSKASSTQSSVLSF
eukprot:jgi/Hompol1/4237/HPOL_001185-RA